MLWFLLEKSFLNACCSVSGRSCPSVLLTGGCEVCPHSQSLGHRRTWALLLGQDLCCLFLAEFGIAPVRLGATVHLCSSAGREKGRRPSEGKFPGSVSRHVSGVAPARCGVADSEQLLVPGSGHCLIICLAHSVGEVPVSACACLLCWQTQALL